MAIQAIEFDPEEDYHLVPGTYLRLDQRLFVREIGAELREAASALPGLDLEFKANFPAGDPRTAGVSVDPQTGQVSVAEPLSQGERLLHFVVCAIVRDAEAEFKKYVRFYIHDAAKEIWLTPAKLTLHEVPQDPSTNEPLINTDARFTVLAHFGDGSIGDITNWSRASLRRSGTDEPVLEWGGYEEDVLMVGRESGLLACLQAQPSTDLRTIAVTVRLDTLESKDAIGARVELAPSWDVPIDVELIDGPGASLVASAKNVLILPDGFTAGDRPAFEKLTRTLVHRFRTRKRTRPFDLLRDRINYFRAWVPSREFGISALELLTRNTTSLQLGEEQELWTTIPEDQFESAWTIGVALEPALTQAILLNERDTAFQTAVGKRPRVVGSDSRQSASCNPRRVSSADLDRFLGALRCAEQPTIGSRWRSGGPDQNLIVFLCATGRDGAVNTPHGDPGDFLPRNLFINLGFNKYHRFEEDLLSGYALLPEPIPERPDIDIWSRVLHELCHSFNLDDEYGNGIDRRITTVPDGEVKDWTRTFKNTQLRDDILTEDGQLDVDNIHWNWPRIEKAGVLAQSPVQAGAEWELTLELGQAKVFAPGDIVRLRPRPLPRAGRPEARPHSPRLKVLEVVSANDLLVTNPLEALPDGFAEAFGVMTDSIVFAPKRTADPDRASDVYGDDLQLVHEATLARMRATRNPLNTDPNTAPQNCTCCGLELAPVTLATNYDPAEPAPVPPRYSGWIVGLFENGHGYDCGVYRPSGICLMRLSRFQHASIQPSVNELLAELSKKEIRAYQQLCPVCRYILVDAVDPTQHGRIDRDYDRRYPK